MARREQMQPSIVRTAPCPRCQSTRTLAFLDSAGACLVRGCHACGHEWDASEVAARIDTLTMADFYDFIDRERAEDIRLRRDGNG